MLICLKSLFLHSFQCWSFQRRSLIITAASLILLIGLKVMLSRKLEGKREKLSQVNKAFFKTYKWYGQKIGLDRSAGNSLISEISARISLL